MENRTINIAVVAEVAKALKNIKKDMVFVGGAVVSLYTDDPAADEIKPLLVSAKLRPTKALNQNSLKGFQTCHSIRWYLSV
jgi:hypothetical protein